MNFEIIDKIVDTAVILNLDWTTDEVLYYIDDELKKAGLYFTQDGIENTSAFRIAVRQFIVRNQSLEEEC